MLIIDDRILKYKDEVNDYCVELHMNLNGYDSAQVHFNKLLPDIKISTLFDVGVYEIEKVSVFEYHIKKGRLFEWLPILKNIINQLNEEIEKGTELQVTIKYQ